ncbi:MAG: Sll0314/Alr1548 family TPR repeat-containing protein [Halothece sp.]
MKSLLSQGKKGTVATVAGLLLLINVNPAFAGDPFRTSNPRSISDNTEAAFEAMFKGGNYEKAGTILKDIPNEADPLAYALMASLAYTNEEWEGVKEAADQTLATAEEIGDRDPLRQELYLAIGHFLEGSYLYQTKGPFSVMKKLQKVFHHLDAAEKHDANDPELNLVKGYMDLILAVNLPFMNVDDAIAQFENNAAPKYLVDRGLAVAYRDLDQYDQAYSAVEKAIAATPDNPEIHYLKGQILYHRGKENQDTELLREAVKYFDNAIARSEQLPDSVSGPYERERRLAQELLEEYQTAQR